MSLSNVITRTTFLGIQLLSAKLLDEVKYHSYAQGSGKAGSPAKALRRYGFTEKHKDKLLKEVAVYLARVEVI